MNKENLSIQVDTYEKNKEQQYERLLKYAELLGMKKENIICKNEGDVEAE